MISKEFKSLLDNNKNNTKHKYLTKHELDVNGRYGIAYNKMNYVCFGRMKEEGKLLEAALYNQGSLFNYFDNCRNNDKDFLIKEREAIFKKVLKSFPEFNIFKKTKYKEYNLFELNVNVNRTLFALSLFFFRGVNKLGKQEVELAKKLSSIHDLFIFVLCCQNLKNPFVEGERIKYLERYADAAPWCNNLSKTGIEHFISKVISIKNNNKMCDNSISFNINQLSESFRNQFVNSFSVGSGQNKITFKYE